MRLVLGVTILFLNLTCYAAGDPFNALIWNRYNQKAGNGSVDTNHWYEWWYFKVIDPVSNKPFFFIYGVVNPWDSNQSQKNSRAHVGFGSFSDNWWIEEMFPVTKFQADYDKLNVKIEDENSVNSDGLRGHIHGQSGDTKHEVSWNFKTQTDWKFNAMGWAMDKPWTSNIYWYPAQANLYMSGEIIIDGNKIKIENAQGYQDRNWGRTFPKWWAWMVANGFKNHPESVLASGGGLPRVANQIELPLFSIGFRHKGREYSFRVNDGDFFKIDISFGHWYVQGISHQGYKIELYGEAPPEKFMDIVFTTPQNEDFHDYETLSGHLKLKLFKREGLGWKLIADLETESAGIEFGSFLPVPEPILITL